MFSTSRISGMHPQISHAARCIKAAALIFDENRRSRDGGFYTAIPSKEPSWRLPGSWFDERARIPDSRRQFAPGAESSSSITSEMVKITGPNLLAP